MANFGSLFLSVSSTLRFHGASRVSGRIPAVKGNWLNCLCVRGDCASIGRRIGSLGGSLSLGLGFSALNSSPPSFSCFEGGSDAASSSLLACRSFKRGVTGYTLLVCVAIFNKWSGVATMLLRLSFCQNKPIARTALDFRISSPSIINMSWSEKSLPAQIPFVHCTLYMVVVCTMRNISGQNRLRPSRTQRSIQPHQPQKMIDIPSKASRTRRHLLETFVLLVIKIVV